MSLCRIDDKPIRTREPVTEPDVLAAISDRFTGQVAAGNAAAASAAFDYVTAERKELAGA
jgi:Pyruvate/2-oxoacid:ferredoxin oxidoreductase gamma subunit